MASSDPELSQDQLPEGWFLARSEQSGALLAELVRELPAGHVLHGARVQVVAHRNGATDDVLVRHLDDPRRVTVVHLTWLGRTEIEGHPTVEFDGTFEGFVEEEERLWGLCPPRG